MKAELMKSEIGESRTEDGLVTLQVLGPNAYENEIELRGVAVTRGHGGAFGFNGSSYKVSQQRVGDAWVTTLELEDGRAKALQQIDEAIAARVRDEAGAEGGVA